MDDGEAVGRVFLCAFAPRCPSCGTGLFLTHRFNSGNPMWLWLDNCECNDLADDDIARILWHRIRKAQGDGRPENA